MRPARFTPENASRIAARGRRLAAELRAAAENTTDAAQRSALERIAESHERIAERAERASTLNEALDAYGARLAEHGRDWNIAAPTCVCSRTFGSTRALGLHVAAQRRAAGRAFDMETAR